MQTTITTPKNLRYEGYPDYRLFADKQFLSDCSYTLPDGDWSVQINADAPLPSEDEQSLLKSQGLVLDKKGRPIHPMLDELISDKNFGVVTGRGYFYNWGPNRTADAVVVYEGGNEPEVALIQRSDTRNWAFIGGFIDGNETTAEAAAREVSEETNCTLIIDPTDALKTIYRGIQILDPRSTAHAWIFTEAVLFRVKNKPGLSHGDDAIGAKWHRISTLKEVISPSHLAIASKLIEYYQTNF